MKTVALANGSTSSGSHVSTLASRLAALAETHKYDIEFAGDAFLASPGWLADYERLQGAGADDAAGPGERARRRG